MADKIKQSGQQVGRVLPLNPARDAGERKRRKPRQSPDDKAPSKRPNDGTHHVDEYA